MPTEPMPESQLAEIEDLARADTGEPYRGALLALVAEVRRLRGVVLGGQVRAGGGQSPCVEGGRGP